MPGSSRRDIIREGEIATYHVWSQTALQRFLLGRDYDLKQNNEHRRAWCDSLIGYFARIFAVDVGSFQPMDNHFHLIVRTRPDLVTNLTNEEVAYRWRSAWPTYNKDKNEWYRHPTDAEINKLLANPDKLMQVRANLSSLSWFVGRIKECISKLANAEVGTKGHFWAERFGSRELVDDAAVFTGMLYTDLNQVRAGMAPSLQESLYATIQARIIESRLKEAEETLEVFHQRVGEELSVTLAQLQDIYLRCSWLAPIDPQGDLKLFSDAWDAYAHPEKNTTEGTALPILDHGQASPPSSRASEAPDVDVNTVACRQLPADFSSDIPQEASLAPREQQDASVDDALLKNEAIEGEGDASLLATPGEPTTLVENPSADSRDSTKPDGDIRTQSEQEAPSKDPKSKKSKASQELKSKMKSRAKAQAVAKTYEIHNRLFPKLPLRASNSPILAMPLEQYLRLAEAAAERELKLRESKSSRDSAISTVLEDLAEILRNLGIHCEEWYATLDAFHERFYYLVGTPEHVAEMVARRGKQRAFGMNACRKAFRDIPPSPGDATEAPDTAEKVPCGASRDSDSS